MSEEEKQCMTCKHTLNLSKNGPCVNCNSYDKWEPRINHSTLPEESTMNWIQPCVYEGLVRMYDRYWEVALTAPMKKESPEMMNMDQFFNHILVRGLLNYGEFLLPMEKELGII